jgi:hypothetical protein
MAEPRGWTLRPLSHAPRSGSSPVRGRLRCALPMLLSLAVIALLTLGRGAAPSPDEAEYIDPYCLICGERQGAADAVLNFLLFVPFGLAAARCWGWFPSLMLGAALSASIEIVQTAIPNRFPTVGDIVWNSAGAALGAALVHGRAALGSMRPPARLLTASALMVLPLLPATLRRPAPTPELYFAQWAPSVSEQSYGGRVTSAALDGIEVPSGPLPQTDDIRDGLRRGAPLRISFVTVVSSDVPSHVFRFVDSRGAEIVSLAIRGQDVVWTERTMATAAAFRSPRLAWVGALSGIAAGSEATLIVRKEDGLVCMKVDTRERCGLGLRQRDGWQLLLPDAGPGLRGTAGVLWLAVPAFLAGLLAGGLLLPTAGAAAVALGVFSLLVMAPGVAGEPLDLVLLVGGLIAGSASMRVAAARSRTGAASA